MARFFGKAEKFFQEFRKKYMKIFNQKWSEPGVKTIWRGFRKLYNYAEMWQLFQPNDLLEGGLVDNA